MLDGYGLLGAVIIIICLVVGCMVYSPTPTPPPAVVLTEEEEFLEWCSHIEENISYSEKVCGYCYRRIHMQANKCPHCRSTLTFCKDPLVQKWGHAEWNISFFQEDLRSGVLASPCSYKSGTVYLIAK
jgi:ribosomal protein L40E